MFKKKKKSKETLKISTISNKVYGFLLQVPTTLPTLL